MFRLIWPSINAVVAATHRPPSVQSNCESMIFGVAERSLSRYVSLDEHPAISSIVLPHECSEMLEYPIETTTSSSNELARFSSFFLLADGFIIYDPMLERRSCARRLRLEDNDEDEDEDEDEDDDDDDELVINLLSWKMLFVFLRFIIATMAKKRQED
ncbi:hypothetical protein HZH68_003279 [Vespula germanica]|uniref:Uncharacterized protein n=1 Tax=Vespula germanica TaxID=30212 RepID=A0A834NNU2_VESGE|nr:hypothetical protein HZH68_003279 [Vespula germanica]